MSANVIKHLEFFFKASSEELQARKPCDKVCSLDSCGEGCPSDGWRQGRGVAKMKLVFALSSELPIAEQGVLQRAKVQI